MIIRVLGLQIANTELVPLTYYDPGSLAVVVWIRGFGDHCSSCPWRYAYDPERSLSQRYVEVDRILKIAERRKLTNIVFHGGDYVDLGGAKDVSMYIASRGFDLVVKHRMSKPVEKILSARDHISGVVGEVSIFSDDHGDRVLRNIQSIVDEGIYMEIALVDLKPELELSRKLRDVIDGIKALEPAIPINIYGVGIREEYLMLIKKIVKDTCRNTCYILEENLYIYPEHVYCRSCGKVVGKRIHNVIVKPLGSGENGECHSCGFRNYYKLSRTGSRIPLIANINI